MSAEEAFLAALRANPADDTARLVYADWLDDRDESAKAEYLRLTDALIHAPDDRTQLTDQTRRIVELGETLPEEWRSAAAGRFDLVFQSLGSTAHCVAAIKAVRELTGAGLAEMKAFLYALPQRVFGWLPFDSAVAFRDYLVTQVPSGDIRLRLSDQASSPYPTSFDITAQCGRSSGTTWDDPDVLARAQLAFRSFLAAVPLPPAMVESAVLVGSFLLATEVRPAELVRRLQELRTLAATHSSSNAWYFSVRATPRA
jgi:uncharacterized protein (TIGR02996 family)